MKLKEAIATLLALQEKLGDEYEIFARDLFGDELAQRELSIKQAIQEFERRRALVGNSGNSVACETATAAQDLKYGDFDGIGFVIRPIDEFSHSENGLDGVRKGQTYTRLLWGKFLNSHGEVVG